MLQEWISVAGWHHAFLAGLSLNICALIVLFGEQFPRFNGRAIDLSSVQTSHTCLTPRVGGIAVFATLALGIAFAPADFGTSYGNLILAASVLFVVGLLEDLGIGISPKRRLLAGVVASLVAIVLLGAWLPRVDIPGLDLLLHHWAVGIPLTVLVTVGITNGFNLIDGVNGLAAVTAIAGAAALGMIAAAADYTSMVYLCMILAASVTGFFLLNFPFGMIFLGDAGAYTLGFILSWFGIFILLNVPEASPWAILLTLFWPVADTILAIYRRVRRTAPAMSPDRLHVHQVVMRALEICFLGRKQRKIANPLTTLILAPFIVAPPIVGVLLWDHTILSFVAIIVFGTLFFVSYALAPALTGHLRRGRARPGLSVEPAPAILTNAQRPYVIGIGAGQHPAREEPL